jgi:predicted SAM-dependent methyltransferase
MRRINIGCGPYPKQDASGEWVNIDANPLQRPDIVRDVRRGLPFDSSSCEEVLTSHFLEHLASDDVLFLIGEIYRVLCPGGIWSIVVPLENTGDIDHKMLFTKDSFDILLRPEASTYFQMPMAWREIEGSRRVVREQRGIHSLHLRLVAVK